MKLHPQNETPGVSDMAPAPGVNPVTTKDLVELIELLERADRDYYGRFEFRVKLRNIKERL